MVSTEKHVQLESCELSFIWGKIKTVARQASLSTEFSRQEYRSGLPFPSPGDLRPRDQTRVSCNAGDSLPSETPGKPQW